MSLAQLGITQLQAVYVSVFGLGAVGCWLGAIRAGRLSHPDTQIGLSSLLILCGSWSAGTSLRLLVPDPTLSRVIYLIELVVGLAAVGAWLYFASAYTGESYHQESLFRWSAVGVFLGLTTVKLTNPLHGLYLTTTMVSTPFPHLVIEDFGLHLAVMGLAYALSAIGFYMLFQMLTDSRAETTKLFLPVMLAGFPVIFNVLGQLEVPGILALSYEPLGVAAFGLGVLYFTEVTFETARWTRHQRILDEINEVIIIVDNETCIRDFNAAAEQVFPSLADGVGSPLADVCPVVAEALRTDERTSISEDTASTQDPHYDADLSPELNLIELTHDGEQRYYEPSAANLNHDSYTIGQAIICMDVTLVERHRRELSRQNEQLDGFSAAVAHELRNTLMVVSGNLTMINEMLTSADEDLIDAVQTSIDTTDRMQRIVDDLTTLARYSQTVDAPQVIEFQDTLSGVPLLGLTSEVTIELEGDGKLKADPDRLEELLRQAARLTAATGGTRLQIELVEGGLVLTTDGEPVPEGNTTELFTYGTAVPNANAGMLGANIQAIARAHGWKTAVDGAYRDGIQIHITGIQIPSEDGY